MTLTTPENREPADHPIRVIKRLADATLEKLDAMYAERGRSSPPPERLLKAELLITFYSIRSEWQFWERLDYDLLVRFFLDMSLDEATWDSSTFAKNRDRLVEHDVSKKLFEEIVRASTAARMLSAEYFTVDGTLIEA